MQSGTQGINGLEDSSGRNSTRASLPFVLQRDQRKSTTPRDSRGCEPARRGPVRRRGRAVIRIATSVAPCVTPHRAPTSAFMLGGEELSSCLVRWHMSSDGLSELDLEVAHARVGLVIHTHEPLLLTKHFSNCNNGAELFV